MLNYLGFRVNNIYTLKRSHKGEEVNEVLAKVMHLIILARIPAVVLLRFQIIVKKRPTEIILQ